jgi:hypothetical protein
VAADGAVPQSLPRGNKPHETLPQQEKYAKEMIRKTGSLYYQLYQHRGKVPLGAVFF